VQHRTESGHSTYPIHAPTESLPGQRLNRSDSSADLDHTALDNPFPILSSVRGV